MALAFTFPTSATLTGAARLNRIHRAAAQEDIGFKLERMISALSILQSAISSINTLQSAVSQIHVALGSAAASLAGASLFSAFSAYAGVTSPGTVSTGATITAWSALANFRS